MLEQNSVGASCVMPNEAEAGADDGANKDNELVLQLTVQLAEAINLQDRDLIAQLHETIRCVRQFDNHEYVLVASSRHTQVHVHFEYIVRRDVNCSKIMV